MTLPRATARLPDFIIGGAMKSGTTTLHEILSGRKDVHIPDQEIHFFSLDDHLESPDFNVRRQGGWIAHDYEARSSDYLSWYQSFFSDAQPWQLIGEDSTTYLGSRLAPERIKRLLPEVKLIFLLRDPVDRAYSHYWHLVNTGRIATTFESLIQEYPGSVLSRSCYTGMLERYFDRFPRDNILVVIFERFVEDSWSEAERTFDFLDLPELKKGEKLRSHRNRATGFKSVRLQLMINRLLHDQSTKSYLGRLPESRKLSLPWSLKLQRLLWRVMRQINFSDQSYPAINSDTRDFLRSILSRENAGLSNLVGCELKEQWPWLR